MEQEVIPAPLKGEVIEPLTVRQRLAAHCEAEAGTSREGDYFHVLARDALKEIERLRSGLEMAERHFERNGYGVGHPARRILKVILTETSD